MKHHLKAMRQGGALLADVKAQLVAAAAPGTSFGSIDQLAEKLLRKTGGQPSFQLVPGYHWSTCINVNDGIVHGIPHPHLKIADGDLVTIDVGLFFKGFHTDTSTSFVAGHSTPKKDHFLQVGRDTLKKAISVATPGNRVWDISHAIQTLIEAAGFSVVRDLTGHGVGEKLHQEPGIPCYTDRPKSASPILENGQTIAIEVMYTRGDWHLVKAADDWTLATADKSLSAVFEETVIVAPSPQVITAVS